MPSAIQDCRAMGAALESGFYDVSHDIALS